MQLHRAERLLDVSTTQSGPTSAWAVDFFNGDVGPAAKFAAENGRAVRDGL